MKSQISDILTVFLATAGAVFSTDAPPSPPPDRATRSWTRLLLPSSIDRPRKIEGNQTESKRESGWEGE
jgi:hypothetical protein